MQSAATTANLFHLKYGSCKDQRRELQFLSAIQVVATAAHKKNGAILNNHNARKETICYSICSFILKEAANFSSSEEKKKIPEYVCSRSKKN